MGKSRGLRRVSFSSSGAIRTSCNFFALARLLETKRRESKIGMESIEHLQRTRLHVWAEIPVAAAEDLYVAVVGEDGEGIDRVLEVGTERQTDAIIFFSLTLTNVSSEGCLFRLWRSKTPSCQRPLSALLYACQMMQKNKFNVNIHTSQQLSFYAWCNKNNNVYHILRFLYFFY